MVLAFTTSTVAAIATIATYLVTTASAHGYITQPAAEFTGDDVMKTNYITRIAANDVFPGVKFDDSPEANTAMFNKLFSEQTSYGYQSLRAFLDAKGGQDCGFTNPNASPKPIPADGSVIFQNPDSGEGFVPSHNGPCSIYLDDTLVFSDDDCAAHYTSHPQAVMNVDFSSCKAPSCMLRFYWLTFQEADWQVYKDCVPLVGAGDASPSTPSMTPSTVPSSPSESPSSPASGPAFESGETNEATVGPHTDESERTPSPTPSKKSKKPCW